ncbi:MAG: phenolic acid decarboxylase [Rhodobacteraceae bacterium CG2_30_10_405]|nr:MAG: phenolic acid decarboxylase [Rhodobacteraceae bacterium CG2_30_10_405]
MALPLLDPRLDVAQALQRLAELGYRGRICVLTASLPDRAMVEAELRALATTVHPIGDVGAAIASGSCPVTGMIVAPCSMRSLAAIALGLDDNLLTRAASVQLKERRALVLLAREAPLTLAHLRAMTQATEMGAIIAPPVPAFYLRPASLAEVVDQIAARAVDLLHLAAPVARAWGPAAPPRPDRA